MRAAGLALGFMLWGVAAQALTPDGVWAGWQSSLADLGVRLEAGGTAHDSGRLVLTDVTLRPIAVLDAGHVVAHLSALTLTPAAAGTVVVEPGAELRITAGSKGDDVALLVTQDGLSVTLSDAGGLRYDFAATALHLGLTVASDAGFAADMGVEPPSATLRGQAELTGLAGSWTDVTGAVRDLDARLMLDQLHYDGLREDPKTHLSAQFKGSKDRLRYDLHLSLPLNAPLPSLSGAVSPAQVAATLARALTAGLQGELQAAAGASSFESSTGARGTVVESVVETRPSTGSIGFDRAGFHANSETDGMTMRLHGPNLPVQQVVLGMGKLAFRISGPLVGDAAQAFGFKLTVADLVAAAPLWQALDPGSVLPRDPASLAIDIGGTARLDLLGLLAAQGGGMNEVAKPSIESLEVRELALSGLGAALAGKGAFTFDNRSAVPVPVGTGEVTVDGVNGVLDGLVQLDLISGVAARNARLAMALVFDKGDGADRQVSRLEARADGSVYVNGVRMK